MNDVAICHENPLQILYQTWAIVGKNVNCVLLDHVVGA